MGRHESIRRDRPVKEHTPGPWTFDGDNVEALDLDHPESICTIADPHPINGDRRVTNGLLIAAAPDLLAAAEAGLEWARIGQDHGGNPYTKQFVRLATAAIEKATDDSHDYGG